MKSATWLVILCCSVLLKRKFFSTAASVSTDNSSTDHTVSGYGSEVMLSKLDYLQYKLHEMEFRLQEHDEELAEKLTKLESSFETVQWAITRHDRDAGYNLTLLQEQARKMLAQQTACANHEQMRLEIARVDQKLNLSQSVLSLLGSPGSPRKRSYSSCSATPVNSSGVYSLQMNKNEAPFEAFCEQVSFGGGWLVIQHRFDGSLDFYQPWAKYRDGFGSVYQEFWIGFERLHQLTSQRKYELMVEMKDFTGKYKYAHYKEFQIGSETEQYPLTKLAGYEGTAGDSLAHHQGAKFTTKDRDNDENGSNCAEQYEGAWWYRNCHASNLNGRYMNSDSAKSMCWHSFESNYKGLAFARMMIRDV